MDKKTCKSIMHALSVRVRTVLSDGVTEMFPWDYIERAAAGPAPLLLDIRSRREFQAVRIMGSMNVPCESLERASDERHTAAVPELVAARRGPILVICVSGKRSLQAARTLARLGYRDVATLRTGLRGWNDYDLPLYNHAGEQLDPDHVEAMFSPQETGRLTLGEHAVA